MNAIAAWVFDETIAELYGDIDRNLRMQQNLVLLLIAILIGMLMTCLYGARRDR